MKASRPKAGVSAVVDYLLLTIGLIVLWAIPHRISGDGEVRFEVLERLFATGKLSAPRYSVVAPLLATPLGLLGRAIGDAKGMTAHFNALLFTIALVLLARELSPDLGSGRRRRVLLLLVFASMFPSHVQVFYGEVLTTLAVMLGVLWLARGRVLAGGAAIVIGAVNTPAALVGVSFVAVRAALRQRRLGPLLLPGLVFALVCVENLAMRGGAFITGYENDAGFRTVMPYSGLPGFSYPFVFGVLAIGLSFGKGLLFFTPGLFIPVAKDTPERLRWAHGTMVLFVLGLVVVYARWWSWYGGSFWGPRFFLAASVPASLALATRLDTADRAPSPRRDVLLLVAVALSFWVGVNGLVFDQNGLDLCWRDGYALEALCHFTPERSVLFHPFVDFASAVPAKTRPLALAVCALWAGVFAWTARHVIARVARAVHVWARRTLARALRLG